MIGEMDYEDFGEDVLFEIQENKRRKKIKEDEESFKSSINKKKLSKAEMDELFLY